MNHKQLKLKMMEYGDTQTILAKDMGLSLSRLNVKLNTKRGAEFTQAEILFIVKRYQLSALETMDIFFDQEVS